MHRHDRPVDVDGAVSVGRPGPGDGRRDPGCGGAAVTAVGQDPSQPSAQMELAAGTDAEVDDAQSRVLVGWPSVGIHGPVEPRDDQPERLVWQYQTVCGRGRTGPSH